MLVPIHVDNCECLWVPVWVPVRVLVRVPVGSMGVHV